MGMLIGVTVAQQRQQLSRLNATSLCRHLSDDEVAILAELIRLEAQRKRKRELRLPQQIEQARQRAERAQARFVQLMGLGGVPA